MVTILHRCAPIVSKPVACFVLAISLSAVGMVTVQRAQGADDTRAYKTISVDPKYQGNLSQDGQRVLGGCIEMLRKASPETHVDAFVENQSIRYAGSEVERFQLEKCMAQYGFPIVSMHRPGLPDK